eukprot:XP_011420330.1 PREDICTED: eukaryotic peptide chain release factor GTP-binding subunit [Crassostrea gigas]
MKAVTLAIALCIAVASVQGYIGGYNNYNSYSRYPRHYGNMYNNYHDDDYYMGGMRGYNSYRSPFYRSIGYNNIGRYPGSYLSGGYNNYYNNYI